MNAYVEVKGKRFTVAGVDRLRSAGPAVEMLRARPGQPDAWEVVAVVGVEKALVTLGQASRFLWIEDGDEETEEEEGTFEPVPAARSNGWPVEPPPDVDAEA